MIGSDPNLVAIVIPLVALPALAFWLGLCFYAGSHPYWRHHQQPNRQQLAGPRQTGPLPPPDTPGLTASGGGTTGGAAGPQRVAHG